jgi:hypothetical protein
MANVVKSLAEAKQESDRFLTGMIQERDTEMK